MNILNSVIFGSLGTFTASHIIEKEMKNYGTDLQPPIDTVSIVMPAYNEEEFIETASSIRNQSILQKYPKHFEFIIIDNGSTDNTIVHLQIELCHLQEENLVLEITEPVYQEVILQWLLMQTFIMTDIG